MTRNNLAVCFSPVIFRFSLEKKTNIKQAKLDSSTNSYSKSMTSTNGSETTVKFNQTSAITPTHLTSQPLEISTPVPQKVVQPETNNNNEISTSSKTNESDSTRQKSEISLAKQNSNDYKSFSEQNSYNATEDTCTVTEMNSATTTNLLQNSHTQQISQPLVSTNQSTTSKQNYKRKYSEKINKAASSLVNFGAELSSSKHSAFFSDSFKENLENMSKVIQLCVSDMIKYSMDLFTVRI